MTITMAPARTRAEFVAADIYGNPLTAAQAASAGAYTTLKVRADHMTAGLMVTQEIPDGSGGFQRIEPLKVTAIDPYGDRLLFTFANGIRLAFAPKDRVEMVCAPISHPSWCDDCDTDEHDGVVRHASKLFTSDAGSAYAVRYDDPDGTHGEVMTEVVVGDSATGDVFEMPPAALRALGRLLLDVADQVDGEQDVPVEDVRIGDLIQVNGVWLPIVKTFADEPYGTVELWTDPEESSRQDVFEDFGTPIRIRRGGAR